MHLADTFIQSNISVYENHNLCNYSSGFKVNGRDWPSVGRHGFSSSSCNYVSFHLSFALLIISLLICYWQWFSKQLNAQCVPLPPVMPLTFSYEWSKLITRKRDDLKYSQDITETRSWFAFFLIGIKSSFLYYLRMDHDRGMGNSRYRYEEEEEEGE